MKFLHNNENMISNKFSGNRGISESETVKLEKHHFKTKGQKMSNDEGIL